MEPYLNDGYQRISDRPHSMAWLRLIHGNSLRMLYNLSPWSDMRQAQSHRAVLGFGDSGKGSMLAIGLKDQKPVLTKFKVGLAGLGRYPTSRCEFTGKP